MSLDAHLVVTDSGLGGLSICAALERRLRKEGGTPARITYVNAWPFEGRGYNDLPDVPARAAVFDRALDRMARWSPDRILIACNTLSIIYARTAFCRAPPVQVDGIIDAGVDLFAEVLMAEPSAGLILLGTKTTIESGVHAGALVQRGVDPHRMRAVHCHGLAGAIERDPESAAVTDVIASCAARVRAADPGGVPLFAGLCCTHYGYVADRICTALGAALGRPVLALDPNARMVDDLALDAVARGAHDAAAGTQDRLSSTGDAATRTPDQLPGLGAQVRPPGQPSSAGGAVLVSVEVISKVALDDTARQAIARLVAPTSPATAQALLSYSHVPDLF
jgi:glutamate racemase